MMLPFLFNPLDYDGGFVLWTIVTFLAMLFIMKKVAWAPLMASIDERESKIKGDIESAERARIEAEETLKKYTAQLEDATQEAKRVVDEARSVAEKAKEGILDEARAEAESLKEQARKDLEAARDKAMSDIKSYVVDVALSISTKVVSKAVDREEHQRLADEMLSKVGGRV